MRKTKRFPSDVPTFLTLVMPMYNEADRIKDTLDKIAAFADKMPFTLEVIFVDDASTDGTGKIVETYLKKYLNWRMIRNDQHSGKGFSVMEGLYEATGIYRFFSDADMSVPIDTVIDMMKKMKISGPDGPEHDLVIGSRRVKGAVLKKRQPFFRELLGRIYSVLVRIFVVRGYLDTQCGFKVMTEDVAMELLPRMGVRGFGFDVEMIYIAKKILNLRVLEFPVEWEDSARSSVHPIRDSLRMFADLFVVLKRNHDGYYGSPIRRESHMAHIYY